MKSQLRIIFMKTRKTIAKIVSRKTKEKKVNNFKVHSIIHHIIVLKTM
jgi:hypothetical protein